MSAIGSDLEQAFGDAGMGFVSLDRSDVRDLSAVIYGEAGSGKTTAALGLALLVAERAAARSGSSRASIGAISTEPGLGLTWRKRYAERAAKSGVAIVGPPAPTRSFSALLEFLELAREKGCAVVVIDSVTHFRRDCELAYRNENGLSMLGPGHRELVNLKWREFTDRVACLGLPVILVGRAADQYDDEADEDSGRRSRVRTGVRADAGRDLAYEPLLVVETSSARLAGRRSERGKVTGAVVHRCTVVKDRTGSLHGQRFDRPTLDVFAPVLDALEGGEHVAVDFEPSAGLYSAETKRRTDAQARGAIYDDIVAAFDAAGFGGQTKEARQKRAQLLLDTFGTAAEDNLRAMKPFVLEEGLGKIEDKLAELREAAEKVGAPS